MDKAKAAVSSFMGKAGHHDTTVHESVAPAVQKETVNEHRREEQQVVKDREVHQDHYHTTVQPVKDQEVLPEQHHHNLVGVEHRTHDHRDHEKTKDHLHREAAQFKNESTRAPTAHTTSTTVPEVAGEHVHHHVHEKIQPVVHKQTIEPHVVHTTVPIHETHHNAAQHHTTSALPAVNMSDFNKQGGHLGGHNEEVHRFKGEPQNLTQNLGRSENIGRDQHVTPGNGHGIGGHSGAGLGHTGNNNNVVGSGLDGKMGSTHHHQGLDNAASAGQANTHSGHNHQGLDNASSDAPGRQTHKPSLMDKLNPKKDADGDGKAGFMS